MIEELGQGIHRIEIGLPHTPLKSVNAYFIRGGERNLLIDLGFNHPDCQEEMTKAMEELGFSMRDTDIFLTHYHADHSGLVGWLMNENTKVICSEYSAQFMTWEKDFFEGDLEEFLCQSGLKAAGLKVSDRSKLPVAQFRSEPIDKPVVVAEGDVIEVGDLKLVCFDTGGHCAGHLCLYEPNLKILFSGDHVLGDITPNNNLNVSPWKASIDPLGSYLENLDKVSQLDLELILPGHRKVIRNCYQRIEELSAHHKDRQNTISEILGNEKLNAVEVSERVPWNISIKEWKDFPIPQKFFSVGEGLSHLNHMRFEGLVDYDLIDGVVYYYNT